MNAMRRSIRSLTACLALGLLAIILVSDPALAQDDDGDDLESLLQDVGAEYAESYAAPFVHTFGPNLNSNLFHTAKIPWAGLTFGIGFKITAASLNEDDQTFRRVVSNVDFDDYISPSSPYYADLTGRTGNLVMSGPTIFGDPDTEGSIQFYSDGLLLAEVAGITGLIDTKFVPTMVPELYVGGMFGLKGTLRYLPEMDLSDYGKTTFMGYGLQWSASGLLPDLPVDMMVGFSSQKLEIGDLLETTASSFFVGASKDFAVLTAYAGLAVESSEMTITYEFEDLGQDIEIEVEGVQDNRGILGAAFSVPGVTINAEVAKGTITTYSAGVMFGL